MSAKGSWPFDDLSGETMKLHIYQGLYAVPCLGSQSSSRAFLTVSFSPHQVCEVINVGNSVCKHLTCCCLCSLSMSALSQRVIFKQMD